jgi:hypothetical protein
MSEARHPMHHGAPITTQPNEARKSQRGYASPVCSVCTNRIWFDPVVVTEPEGVPEPRLSWQLCNACYQALQAQLQKSPLQSPLRVRIAIGLIAAERWPHAYATRIRDYINDRRLIVFIAVTLIVAMLLHLMMIVIIATIK